MILPGTADLHEEDGRYICGYHGRLEKNDLAEIVHDKDEEVSLACRLCLDDQLGVPPEAKLSKDIEMCWDLDCTYHGLYKCISCKKMYCGIHYNERTLHCTTCVGDVAPLSSDDDEEITESFATVEPAPEIPDDMEGVVHPIVVVTHGWGERD